MAPMTTGLMSISIFQMSLCLRWHTLRQLTRPWLLKPHTERGREMVQLQPRLLRAQRWDEEHLNSIIMHK